VRLIDGLIARTIESQSLIQIQFVRYGRQGLKTTTITLPAKHSTSDNTNAISEAGVRFFQYGLVLPDLAFQLRYRENLLNNY
jgi:hypothetical protein